MSRNNMIIKKWLPVEAEEHKVTFNQCVALKKRSGELVDRIGGVLAELGNGCTSSFSRLRKNTIDGEVIMGKLNDIHTTLESIKLDYTKVFNGLNIKPSSILECKVKTWKHQIHKVKLKTTYYLQQLIHDITPLFIFYGEKMLTITFKISNIYNTLLSHDIKYNLGNTTGISSNSCPYLLFPIRKISITRLLQILAQNRAELCSHKLIDCLLETYKLYESQSYEEDGNNSDNSSVEIYKALTNHLTPPLIHHHHQEPDEQQPETNVASKSTPMNTVMEESGNFLNLDKLIEYEEQNVLDLLNVSLVASPSMLGHDGVKKTKNGGQKISAEAKEKVLDYYQEILWGEVGNFLEHIILWWGPSPLAGRPPHSSQHLREWIAQFTPVADVPPFIISTLTSLADGLGVHVTSTSWDRNFRLALVASKAARNPNAGQLFCEMLQDLVTLCNQCEVTNDWIIGAPLDELPLVEQIPVLHRLDHSVHTTRLWAASETKKLANNWNVDGFFMITHCDIVNCLGQLTNVRLVDHSVEIEKGGLGVHVEVCSKMREKLCSEVRTNIQKLKETSKECVECLASVCTTISLANLKMIFPKPSYWNRNNSTPPQIQSPYVYKYLDQILTPVVSATEDYIICNMILKLMCEAWLDHIYTNKIKFTEYGALQLLTDFASISTWITDCPVIKEAMKSKMSKNEVLRRCEGVGRLLLRNPGEKIQMNSKYKKKVDPDASPKSDQTQLMPAEMYVPNQEQWLELRANKKKLQYTLQPLCCGD